MYILFYSAVIDLHARHGDILEWQEAHSQLMTPSIQLHYASSYLILLADVEQSRHGACE